MVLVGCLLSPGSPRTDCLIFASGYPKMLKIKSQKWVITVKIQIDSACDLSDDESLIQPGVKHRSRERVSGMISKLIKFEERKKLREDPTVRTIQEMLNFLGFTYKEIEEGKVAWKPLEVDGLYGKKTESVVIDFQQSEGLIRDGVVGPATMAALDAAWTQRQVELTSPGSSAVEGLPGRLVFVRAQADPWRGEGYSRFSLRSDVAEAYGKVRAEVTAAGGILTSSGGIRSLQATVNASRSTTSMHYLGRALDLYIYSGMADPEGDPYVITREKERTYRVWARCRAGAGVTLPKKRTLKNVTTYEKRKGEAEPVTDHFIDLTDIFKKNGFKGIPARRRFEEGASLMGAEWWHFQYEKGLINKVTTFGSELLKVYARDALEDTPPWKQRDRVWGINWS